MRYPLKKEITKSMDKGSNIIAIAFLKKNLNEVKLVLNEAAHENNCDYKFMRGYEIQEGYGLVQRIAFIKR